MCEILVIEPRLQLIRGLPAGAILRTFPGNSQTAYTHVRVTESNSCHSNRLRRDNLTACFEVPTRHSTGGFGQGQTCGAGSTLGTGVTPSTAGTGEMAGGVTGQFAGIGGIGSAGPNPVGTIAGAVGAATGAGAGGDMLSSPISIARSISAWNLSLRTPSCFSS
jgi:hypothetical protein